MPKFLQEFFRLLAIVTGWPMQLILFKRKTYYEDPAQKNRRIRGGALIISNHYSVFDYMMNMFLFGGRKLNVVMVDRMYKKSRYFHIGMDCFGGICANRDDMGLKFVDESVRIIEKGGLVQIFPEGHITRDGNMLEFGHAYLMIALRSDAPIIPVIIDGNYGLFKRAHVIIGKKIDLGDYCTSLNPTREDVAEMNRIVESKCRQLKARLDELVGSKGSKKEKGKRK